MLPTPRLSQLKKIKAKGVEYRGPYQGKWHHVGVAFECEDVSAVMRLGAAISKDENLAPLLNEELHTDTAGLRILVSFDFLKLNPFGCAEENTKMLEMRIGLDEAMEAKRK